MSTMPGSRRESENWNSAPRNEACWPRPPCSCSGSYRRPSTIRCWPSRWATAPRPRCWPWRCGSSSVLPDERPECAEHRALHALVAEQAGVPARLLGLGRVPVVVVDPRDPPRVEPLQLEDVLDRPLGVLRVVLRDVLELAGAL